MRTRTLLLLAVGCGLVILVAGVVQLLLIAGDDGDGADAHDIGELVAVGDLRVRVVDYTEDASHAVVEVEVSGVDDPDGADGFQLVLPGEVLHPSGDGPDDCGDFTVAEQTCTLTFDLDDPAGGTRFLLAERGDQRARWGFGARGDTTG